jgi:gallate decarboxylase subunit D
MKSLRFSERGGRFRISSRVDLLGRDLLVTVTGGVAHIGAIGIGEPRASLMDSGLVSATGSVLTFPGHKEDGVAKPMAEDLSRALNRRVVVVAGIHWDGLTREDISQILEMCRKLTARIARRLLKRVQEEV